MYTMYTVICQYMKYTDKSMPHLKKIELSAELNIGRQKYGVETALEDWRNIVAAIGVPRAQR